MNRVNPLILTVLPLVLAITCKQKTNFAPSHEVLIGFYNLDNLYDTINDPSAADEEFTPSGKYRWNTQKYQSKLERISTVVRELKGGIAPDILGVCELENRRVLQDLTTVIDPEKRYSVLHFDSYDERGIDVALIYNRLKFKVLDSHAYQVILKKNKNDKTRPILWVKMLSLNTDDTLQMIVCHFPSRREGKEESEENRLDAAWKLREVIVEKCEEKSQNLVIMGDFNDQPWDKSMLKTLQALDPAKRPDADLQNLMFGFSGKNVGTYRFRGQWNLLDQLIISAALTDGKNAEYEANSVGIKSEDWMMQDGKYKGYPLRTFGGNNWLDGYSDHFPVYMTIRLSGNDKKKN